MANKTNKTNKTDKTNKTVADRSVRMSDLLVTA